MNNEIIEQLASSLGRRDEVPNQKLAQKIVQSNDQKAVAVLVEHLKDKRAIQNDCIKVLYEIGAVQASLIAPHASAFLDLLDTKNNRLQWGLLTAINSIVSQKASLIFQHIPRILHTAEQGSVISKDQAMNILINFCRIKKYQKQAFPLLFEQVLKSATNQLPMYAERAATIIDAEHRQAFIDVLESRLPDIEKESKRKRLEKVIRKLDKGK